MGNKNSGLDLARRISQANELYDRAAGQITANQEIMGELVTCTLVDHEGRVSKLESVVDDLVALICERTQANECILDTKSGKESHKETPSRF